MVELVFVEDSAWEREIFKEEIPAEGGDLLGGLSLMKKAEALVERRNSGECGWDWGYGLVHRMDLRLGFKRRGMPCLKNTHSI
jgi:hypothetical protein